jgi:hypothetical protein
VKLEQKLCKYCFSEPATWQGYCAGCYNYVTTIIDHVVRLQQMTRREAEEYYLKGEPWENPWEE